MLTSIPLLVPLLLFLHLLAVAFWVGGMALMHFAVRPAAVAKLDPPQRLPFMTDALARFFAGVWAAIIVLLASGLGLIWRAGGFANVRWNVHLMFGLGLFMMAIYLHIRFSPYSRLKRAVAAREWPVAAASLDLIRKLVRINLLLGVVVIALAVVGRAV
jgi:uncharacterized membrane protein